MKTYEINFIGRKVGTNGDVEPQRAQVFADNGDAAVLALSDRFECIKVPSVKEIQPPFDADTLFNRVQNTQDECNAIRRAVTILRLEIDTAAQRQRQDNADWHDDPDAEDWALFHAGHLAQFPRAVRDAAILELVALHLDILNENETPVR